MISVQKKKKKEKDAGHNKIRNAIMGDVIGLPIMVITNAVQSKTFVTCGIPVVQLDIGTADRLDLVKWSLL